MKCLPHAATKVFRLVLDLVSYRMAQAYRTPNYQPTLQAMQWYYEKDNVQNGPVSEEALVALYEKGELRGNNLVWRDGMGDWASFSERFPTLSNGSAGGTVACPTCGASVASDRLIPFGESQVCANCKDEFAQGLREGLSQPIRRSNDRGTGGQTPNPELRLMAREALSGAWGISALVFFIFWVLQQGILLIPLAGQIVQLLITGPLTLGLMAYFIGLHRGEAADVGTLFSGFSHFLKGLGLYFVTTVLISLASLAAAIPGGVLIALAFGSGAVAPEESPLFIAGIFIAVLPAVFVGMYMYLRYALVYLIAHDDPELGVLAAVKRSAEMMVGRKGKLFVLCLSFIGWHILGALALGIGLLWSMAYMYSAITAFYEDIGEQA